MGLPNFYLGLSGHLDIAPDDLLELEFFLTKKFIIFSEKLYGYSQPVLVTGLARGSDQLGALCALKAGWRIKAVLPFPRDIYIKSEDFENHYKEKNIFSELLQHCNDDVIELISPSSQLDADISNLIDQSYRNQSHYIATMCDAVMVLWDGVAFQAGGCGTSYVIYALNHKYKNMDQDLLPLEIIPIRRVTSDLPAPDRNINWSKGFDQFFI